MRPIWREYLEALLVAVIFATFVRTYTAQAFKIPSGSMKDNLLVGDHILVNKLVYGPAASPLERLLMPLREVRRGDVVVFRYPPDPTRDFIKRCVGVAGDTIEIRNKQLHVNGEPVDESGYARHGDSRTYPASVFLNEEYRMRDNFGPFTVPEGELFFLGDNRDDSHDSRFWGTVSVRNVKGRALLVYWSFAADEQNAVASGSGDRLRQLTEVALTFPWKTRWNRTLRAVR